MAFRVLTLALVLIAAVFVSGCEEKGPAERAGEKIDHAFSEAKEKAEEAGKKVEEAGQRIDEAVREAEEAVEEAEEAMRGD